MNKISALEKGIYLENPFCSIGENNLGILLAGVRNVRLKCYLKELIETTKKNKSRPAPLPKIKRQNNEEQSTKHLLKNKD